MSSAEELYRREPHLGRGALGALEVPDEGIICPFTTPLAFATEAVLGGCELRRGTAVTALERLDGGGVLVRTGGCEWRTRFLVNAAGLRSDELDRMLGHDGFTVTPRRGELIVFDKLSRLLVSHIVLAVPTKITKGVLIAPTVFGNVMLGPTADDVERKDDTSSTAHGLDYLRREGRRIMPELLEHGVTAVYVGLRAATEHTDYQVSIHADEGYACVGGIRSTGLSGSMAIAEHVRGLLGDAGLSPASAGPSGRVVDAEHRRGVSAALRRSRAHRPRLRVRAHRLLLRARHTRRDPRRVRVAGAARRPRRPAAADALAHGSLPGLLLRRRAGGADRGAGRRMSVFVVGGGPAGLAAARELGRLGVRDVVVIEREREAGGIPRHAAHQGFGLRDLRRPLSGPPMHAGSRRSQWTRAQRC